MKKDDSELMLKKLQEKKAKKTKGVDVDEEEKHKNKKAEEKPVEELAEVTGKTSKLSSQVS